MKYDLEERLINFAVNIIKISGLLPKSHIGSHLSGQINRSGTSPALHYGEAESSESRKDFIHKMLICLKELRETRICLLIIQRSGLITPIERLDPLLTECNELISIFVKSVNTAKQKLKSK